LSQLRKLLGKAGKAGAPLTAVVAGGPITDAEDVVQVFHHSSVDGFAGGSVFERIPVEDGRGS
jgi:predicted TIM-barrel enzyme